MISFFLSYDSLAISNIELLLSYSKFNQVHNGWNFKLFIGFGIISKIKYLFHFQL